jgi:hypothetical protein
MAMNKESIQQLIAAVENVLATSSPGDQERKSSELSCMWIQVSPYPETEASLRIDEGIQRVCWSEDRLECGRGRDDAQDLLAVLREIEAEIEKPADWAKTAASRILADLGGRRGIGDALDDVDGDVRLEILRTLADIIRTADMERAV